MEAVQVIDSASLPCASSYRESVRSRVDSINTIRVDPHPVSPHRTQQIDCGGGVIMPWSSRAESERDPSPTEGGSVNDA